MQNGHIIIFRGIIDLTESDDQLAFILAHEMSHAILGHNVSIMKDRILSQRLYIIQNSIHYYDFHLIFQAEKMSQAYLMDLLLIIPLAIIWAILPSDTLAMISHWIICKFNEILVDLPFSRKLESEADIVGLKLAAHVSYRLYS